MQTKRWLLECDVFKWVLVLCLVTKSYAEPYNCSGVCVGLEDSSEPEVEATTVSSEISIETFKLTEYMRFATPCETPNHQVALCMEISKCETLEKVKNKKKYSEFVEASKCGPKNENPKDFRVCCGKYNNFRNLSHPDDTVENTPKAIFDPPLLPQECGKQNPIFRPRIYGGTEAVIGEYPWMVRMIHKNKYGHKNYGCAGFLIHPKYVVTAAHCIQSEFTDIRGVPYSVLLGEHNVTSKIDCSAGGTKCADPPQISKINKTIIHGNYSAKSKNHHNDIGLLYLNKAVRVTDFVRPICLPVEDDPNVKKYYISGWGKTEKAETSTIKLRVDLKPFNKQECTDRFKSYLGLDINESQICAGGEKLKDSCNGDSGGPLMRTNGTHYFAAGLVSYGVGCGMEDWPGVYTSIPYHLNWIKLQILDITTKSPKIRKNKKKKKLLI